MGQLLQCEYIVEELKNPIGIMKFSNIEKIIRITTWVKIFIMRLKISTEVYGTPTAEKL